MKLDIIEIETRMARKGWTQSDFARELKVDRQWVWWLLNGKNDHSMSTITKVADALKCNPKKLLR